MARTTLDLADPILEELERFQRREGRSLGELASELLARALAEGREGSPPPARFTWTARSMGVRIDLEDREALRAALGQREERAAGGG
ncbi:MAG: antitoxin [Thermoanaerobaculia bacterium]|nr:antitoxin [Thermoanaerobaculia bacterium]